MGAGMEGAEKGRTGVGWEGERGVGGKPGWMEGVKGGVKRVNCDQSSSAHHSRCGCPPECIVSLPSKLTAAHQRQQTQWEQKKPRRRRKALPLKSVPAGSLPAAHLDGHLWVCVGVQLLARDVASLEHRAEHALPQGHHHLQPGRGTAYIREAATGSNSLSAVRGLRGQRGEQPFSPQRAAACAVVP